MKYGALFGMTFVICACVLAYHGKQGWGWFLFLACLVDYDK